MKKTLYESLLDIDTIEMDTDTIKYLSFNEFQKMYQRKLKLIRIDKQFPVCVDDLDFLCFKFRAKNIDIKGLIPGSKIKTLLFFAANCANLTDFIGPDSHENFSDIKSLRRFFSADNKLKTFDLNGIAKSVNIIENIDSMFVSCEKIENIDLSIFNFSDSVIMTNSFDNCEQLKYIDLGNSNSIVNAERACRNNPSLIEFNAPGMILKGIGIFDGCVSLKKINVRYIDVSEKFHNVFNECTKLESVRIFGLGKKSGYDILNNTYIIDLSWAVSLNDESWEFLFMSLGDGDNVEILLPDIPKKKNIIKKYELIAKKHNFKLV